MPLARIARYGLMLAALVWAASTCRTNDIVINPPASPTPPPPVPPPPPPPVVLVGAGDIASCDSDYDERTAELLDTIAGTVFTLGDNVYDNGTPEEYANCYDPSWGRHKERTRPSPGNHDYNTAFAGGYFGYFGTNAGDPAKGYYSYDIGAWHIIVLNSNLDMRATSPQVAWLRDDLARSTKRCTIAMWHHPRFSSGHHGNWGAPQPLWQALYDAGAEIVLTGHDHLYERFAPQTPTGIADPQYGIRQFTVGTGGSSNYQLLTVQPNSERRSRLNPGVLKLTLNGDNTYRWQFIPIEGRTLDDSGEGSCHDANPNPPSSTVVLTVASNIGDCTGTDDNDTGRILDTVPGFVLTLGDNAFPDGTLANYNDCYDPAWGRHKARTWATLGNHEYHAGNADGSFDYFGDRVGPRDKGYYSFEVGNWHIIVLNDQNPATPFVTGSAQDQWLVTDLARDEKDCLMAAWHDPLFLSSTEAGYTVHPARKAIWDRLYALGVDVVLNGQQHHYERMAPMKPDGTPDEDRGIRQFNVGTGGESVGLPTVAIHPQSQVRAARYGVLKLTLEPNRYHWYFIPTSGAPVDSGSASCH